MFGLRPKKEACSAGFYEESGCLNVIAPLWSLNKARVGCCVIDSNRLGSLMVNAREKLVPHPWSHGAANHKPISPPF